MSSTIKNQQEILKKLSIEQLNPMQEEAKLAIHSHPEVVLLSPTGTGKTLAFLLPIIQALDPNCVEVQAIIVVPSRELALQIENVTREMGTGFKNNAFYGGRNFSKDKLDLKHPPAILMGTPGRIAAHLRRETFSTEQLNILVLDEFDKSLEVGFETEMKQILEALPNLTKKILTSATQKVEIPNFIGLKSPLFIDFLEQGTPQLKIKRILSPSKDKLDILVKALHHLGNEPGIVFCNFKDSIGRVSQFLTKNGIRHGCFYGGMEQKDRERALIKFRNGTHQLIVATDLAARGIDVPEIKFIVHYQLPNRKDEFIHRNGRTARMSNEGTAYVLQWKEQTLPDFIEAPEIEELQDTTLLSKPTWKTLFVSGGRKDKISKGDIVGLFLKQGKLENSQLGLIEVKQDCAFVAVEESAVNELLKLINNSKLKKKKIRVTVI